MINWIQNWPGDRTEGVVVDFSDCMSVISGISDGTLVDIYTNYVHENVGNLISKCAGNIKIVEL